MTLDLKLEFDKTQGFIKVIDAIIAKAAIWIKFLQTDLEIDAAKQEFQNKYNFPAAIEPLDCTHVKINKQKNVGDGNINRKGYASIYVQATCNAKEVLTSVDVSWRSSLHDYRIWKASDTEINIEVMYGNQQIQFLNIRQNLIRPQLELRLEKNYSFQY